MIRDYLVSEGINILNMVNADALTTAATVLDSNFGSNDCSPYELLNMIMTLLNTR